MTTPMSSPTDIAALVEELRAALTDWNGADMLRRLDAAICALSRPEPKGTGR